MIIKRHWHKYRGRSRSRYNYYGWFLFGFIPIYVVRSDETN